MENQNTTQRLNLLLKSAESLDDFLQKSKAKQLTCTSLKDYFELLFEDKNLKKSDVIKASLIDPYYCYQIFRGEKKKPSRDKLLQLALAMSLSIDETQLLLYLGGSQKLYVKNKFDSIIMFALDHKLDLAQTCELLAKQGEGGLV